ncbi:MAG: hypothetical protein AMJ46_12150 [Latescibacteria bacterium DG_63]|nr:MAG: hypothetical protein AMJ46_12150 [Latescibacteria bacterium DG_63]
MSVEDYRINAQVRAALVRRWIDTSRLHVGTVNRVVYLNGVLCQTYRPRRDDAKDEINSMLSLIKKVEHDIKAIQGVRDVVFGLTNFKKRGGKWRVVARM